MNVKKTLYLALIIVGFTVFDVVTQWELLPVWAIGALILGGAFLFWHNRKTWRSLWLIPVVASLVLHLAYIAQVDYASGHWNEIEGRGMELAHARIKSYFEQIFSRIEDVLSEVSEDIKLRQALSGKDDKALFEKLEDFLGDLEVEEVPAGILILDRWGRSIAWAGVLPQSVEDEGASGSKMRIIRSTTAYWIQGSHELRLDGALLGQVRVYRLIEALYPQIGAYGYRTSLTEELSSLVNHRVGVIWEQHDQKEMLGSAQGAADFCEILLPDGTRCARVAIYRRTLEEEKQEFRNMWLFVASLLVLSTVGWLVIILMHSLTRERFSHATTLRLFLAILALFSLRLLFGVLRGHLRLSDLEAFSPYYYATRAPFGMLRSPADLSITSATLCAALALVVLWIYWTSKRREVRSVEREIIPRLVGGAGLALLTAWLIAMGDDFLRRIYADSTLRLLSESAFDISAGKAITRLGFLLTTVAILLLAGTLIQVEISLLRRTLYYRKWRTAVGVALGLVFVLAFFVGDLHYSILILCAASIGVGLLIDGIVRRKFSPGLTAVVALLGLAATIVQLPHAVEDFYSKGREDIETIAKHISSHTDEWKVSLLEEVLREIQSNRNLPTLVASTDNLDAGALSLWAKSILSRSKVLSGIYIIGKTGQEIGRFSLINLSDMGMLLPSILGAGTSEHAQTYVTRTTIGGKNAEIYVGIVPLFCDQKFVGAVVVAIPYFYDDLWSIAGLKSDLLETITGLPTRETYREYIQVSRLTRDRIVETTAEDFELGRLETVSGGFSGEPLWITHRMGKSTYTSHIVPATGSSTYLLSFKHPSTGEYAVYFMAATVSNMLVVLLVIFVIGVARLIRYLYRSKKGLPHGRIRWSFATKLALGFVLIATVPTLILGTTSRGYLTARLREVVESRAGEGLKLVKLSLERLIFGEAVRLARNPILIDELLEEPSILTMLVSPGVEAAVYDSTGRRIAAVGSPRVSPSLVRRVLTSGRSYHYFDASSSLTGNAIVPVMDVLRPGKMAGCVFLSRQIDDHVAREIATSIGKDVSFYGSGGVVATSRREIFVSELMPHRTHPDAYEECVISGKETHFTPAVIGPNRVIVGYSPLRDAEGKPVGTVAVPVLFRKDEVGRRLEWSLSAISYLLAIVLGGVFLVGLVLARKMAKPIKHLIEGTLRVGSGDLGFSIPRTTDDEIGDLVTSFNRMTSALAKSRTALTKRKKYIETILSNVGAGIISTDRKGRIDTFNAAAEHILGVKARNARGRDVSSFLKKIGAPGLAAAFEEVDQRGTIRREVRFRRKDGSVVTLRAVATPITGPRRTLLGKVIVFEDVTDLIRSKKLIAWSELARQVAHEIKNPLTPMKLSAQHLLRAYKDRVDNLDNVIEESVATIIEQIESLRRIAVEFSQFSRLPERKIESVDVNEIVDECLAQYHVTLSNSIEIVKEFEDDLPSVQVDRDELKRVFINLIDNAIQAMPQGGCLTVTTRYAKHGKITSEYDFIVSTRPTYERELVNFVEIAFTDTGMGIARENSSRLFEPNFSTRTHGTGLGLTICRGIIEAYGGEIVIESTRGVGTRVRVRIPIDESSLASHRPRRRSSRSQHRHSPE